MTKIVFMLLWGGLSNLLMSRKIVMEVGVSGGPLNEITQKRQLMHFTPFNSNAYKLPVYFVEFSKYNLFCEETYENIVVIAGRSKVQYILFAHRLLTGNSSMRQQKSHPEKGLALYVRVP